MKGYRPLPRGFLSKQVENMACKLIDLVMVDKKSADRSGQPFPVRGCGEVRDLKNLAILQGNKATSGIWAVKGGIQDSNSRKEQPKRESLPHHRPLCPPFCLPPGMRSLRRVSAKNGNFSKQVTKRESHEILFAPHSQQILSPGTILIPSKMCSRVKTIVTSLESSTSGTSVTRSINNEVLTRFPSMVSLMSDRRSYWCFIFLLPGWWVFMRDMDVTSSSAVNAIHRQLARETRMTTGWCSRTGRWN